MEEMSNTLPEGGEDLKPQENHSDRKHVFLLGILLGIAISLLVALAIIFGMKLGKAVARNKNGAGTVATQQTLKKIRTIEDVINENLYCYNDEVTTSEMEEGIYRGIIKSLNDPYSEYFSEKELKEEMDDYGGYTYGIGVVVTIDEENHVPVIVSVMEQSPAEEADVQPGDLIYEVEGESVYDMSLSQVVSRVKGREGTTVNISFYREGETELLKKTITRSKMLEVNTVVYGMLDMEGAENIGYIAIEEFDTVTTDQFTEAMAELKAKNMEALVLDLRSNLGGNFNSAVEIARQILPAGMVVYTEDKNGKREEFTCDGERELNIPVVVLVNEYTASAAEILSGAIKDHNKGTLVGTTTYGKGIVQRIIALEDGSAVKVTISAYFTPSGVNIQGTGIEPDIEVPFDRELYNSEGKDTQLDKALEILKGKLGG